METSLGKGGLKSIHYEEDRAIIIIGDGEG